MRAPAKPAALLAALLACSAPSDPPATTASVHDSAPVPAPAPVPVPAPDPSASASSAPAPPPPSRFLIIGDSHIFGPFGEALATALKARPERQVSTYGSCGSSPLTWVKGMDTPCGGYEHPDGKPVFKQMRGYRTPVLKDLLASVKPAHTLVVMGTNFLCCSEDAAPHVRRLLDTLAAAGSGCIWVGPPEGKAPPGAPPPKPGPGPTERLYRVLAAETASRCLLLDARKMGVTVQDPMDEVHVGPATAEAWSRKVADAVDAHLARPR